MRTALAFHFPLALATVPAQAADDGVVGDTCGGQIAGDTVFL